MKVLPLHDIPPVRKPRVPVQLTYSDSKTLPYARRGTIKPRSRRPTLLEIVMVSFLLFIGAAVILPRMVDRDGWPPHGRVEADLSTLEQAVDAFQRDTGRLPAATEDLSVLLTAPADLPSWRGPYIIHPAKDPWGHPYLYRQLPSGNFEIRCVGPDGKANTADDAVLDCSPVQ
jgi:general secretion pathway protein G